MKLTEYLTNSFSREGIISEEDKEIVQFGLESLLGNLLGIVLILTIGICFGHVWEAIFLWIFWFLLRKNAGGFHAETKIGCLLISTVILILSFLMFTLFRLGKTFYGMCVFFNSWIIWLMAPVDNSKKQLELIEYKVYQNRSRIILIAEDIIWGVGAYLKIEVMMRSVAMALFIVSISLVLGKIKNLYIKLKMFDYF